MHGTCDPAAIPAEEPNRAVVIPLTRPRTAPAPTTPDYLAFATWCRTTMDTHGVSLTDPEDAAAYRATLALVENLLNGVRHIGRIDDDQLHYLNGVLTDAAAVPDAI